MSCITSPLHPADVSAGTGSSEKPRVASRVWRRDQEIPGGPLVIVVVTVMVIVIIIVVVIARRFPAGLFMPSVFMYAYVHARMRDMPAHASMHRHIRRHRNRRRHMHRHGRHMMYTVYTMLHVSCARYAEHICQV